MLCGEFTECPSILVKSTRSSAEDFSGSGNEGSAPVANLYYGWCKYSFGEKDLKNQFQDQCCRI